MKDDMDAAVLALLWVIWLVYQYLLKHRRGCGLTWINVGVSFFGCIMYGVKGYNDFNFFLDIVGLG